MVKLLTRTRTPVGRTWPNGEQITENVYLFYPWICRVQGKPTLLGGFQMTANRSKVPHTDNRATLAVHLTIPTVDKRPVSGFQLHVSGADATLVGGPTEGVAVESGGSGNAIELLQSGTIKIAYAAARAKNGRKPFAAIAGPGRDAGSEISS